jgi:uncharacterized protein (TIGR00251 family)
LILLDCFYNQTYLLGRFFLGLGHCKSVDLSSFLRETPIGVEIDLIVSPSSPKSEVQGLDQWRKRLVVKVRAPPEKGEANEEVESVISELFQAKAEVVRGHTSRMKTVLVHSSSKKALEVLEGLDARP